jgi:WD40 repeat protein
LVAFSPDGQTLISGSQDGMVRLWEAARGKEIRHFQTRQDAAAEDFPGSYFAVSLDGSFLASAASAHSAAEAKDLRIWDLATGTERRSFRNPGYLGHGRIAISPDGKLIAWAGQQDAVSLWDANTGQQLRRVKISFAGCMYSIRRLSLFPQIAERWRWASNQIGRPDSGIPPRARNNAAFTCRQALRRRAKVRISKILLPIWPFRLKGRYWPRSNGLGRQA